MTTALEREMAKLAKMGVTVSVTPAPGVPRDPKRPAHLIAEAARSAGILEEPDA